MFMYLQYGHDVVRAEACLVMAMKHPSTSGPTEGKTPTLMDCCQPSTCTSHLASSGSWKVGMTILDALGICGAGVPRGLSACRRLAPR